MSCTCKVGPGKFEGEGALTFLAWQWYLNGCADEDVGGSVWFKGPFADMADKDTMNAAIDYGYCTACITDALASEAYGLSLWESEQGFVWGTEYATKEEYEKALAEAEESESEEGSD